MQRENNICINTSIIIITDKKGALWRRMSSPRKQHTHTFERYGLAVRRMSDLIEDQLEEQQRMRDMFAYPELQMSSDDDTWWQTDEQTTIIGLCGCTEAGKDTAAEACVRRLGFQHREFGGKVRDTIRLQDPYYFEIGRRHSELRIQIGTFDSAKRSYPCVQREFDTCRTTHETLFGKDFWLNACLPVDKQYAGKRIVVSDVQRKEEIARIQLLGGQVWFLRRDGYGPRTDAERLQIEECEPLCCGSLSNWGSREEFMRNVAVCVALRTGCSVNLA